MFQTASFAKKNNPVFTNYETQALVSISGYFRLDKRAFQLPMRKPCVAFAEAKSLAIAVD